MAFSAQQRGAMQTNLLIYAAPYHQTCEKAPDLPQN